jgi:hypothetical protein
MVAFEPRGDDLKELEILSAPQSHAQKLFIPITVENYQVRNAPTPRKSILDRLVWGAASALGVYSWNWELGNYVSSGDAKRRGVRLTV